jgi:hypothetical protein
LEVFNSWPRPVRTAQAQAARYADTAALFQALGGGWWNRGELADAVIAPGQPAAPALSEQASAKN